uniref:Scarecrow-like protein 6 n=1 Tax=Kalanchoe fedtschenkoi TaxID=63787 RepID=A0A7N0SZC8_KALFE
MPLPFDIQGKQQQQQHLGFLPQDLIATEEQLQWSNIKAEDAGLSQYAAREPTSVLDARRSPSPPYSSSTLSSSLGSSASGGAPTPVASQEPCGGGGGGARNNNLDFDQSMFGFILNDNSNAHIDDPAGLSKLISAEPVMPSDLDSLGAIYHPSQHQSGDEFGAFSGNLQESGFGSGQGSIFGQFGNSLVASSDIESLFSQQQHQTIESLINHHQHQQPPQNPSLFLPSGFTDQPIFYLPNPKRLNTGPALNSDHHQQQNQIEKNPFLAQNQLQRQVSMMPASAASSKMILQPSGRIEEMGMHQQAALFQQIFKSAELVSMGNLVLAQGILARLNHQLSPIGKPLQRVAYYFKESLQLLLHMISNNLDVISSATTSTALSSFSPPLSLILKLGAFKSFSDISPVVQFANFTSNQAILEAVEMHDRIHVIDFEIGYGGQWASLMQELALRNSSGGVISLKITAFILCYDDLELGLTRENLSLFAEELNIDLDLKIFGFDMLNSVSHYVSNGEVVAMNLPIGIFSNCALSLPFVLRIIKQLSPKIVVTLERGCDRYDLPFAHNVIQAVESYSNLVESLEAVNGNSEAFQKIERFMIHPAIEKLVLQRFRIQDKSPPWRSVFISSGFTPLQLSNFTESQGECLVQRTPVQGFHLEKKQSSLVLCWQQKELISATAWGC